MFAAVKAGVRRWHRRPARFLAIAGLSAATIGLGTAGYGVLRALLFEPPPVVEPESIASVRASFDIDRRLTGAEMRAEAPRFRSNPLIAAYAYAAPVSLAENEAEEQVWRLVSVSDGFFPLLGVRPLHGRIFGPEDADAPIPSVILAHDVWRGRFGAEPGLVGSVVSIRRQPMRIVGVMPEGFNFPEGATAWALMERTPERNADFVRLAPGATVQELAAQFPKFDVMSLREYLYPEEVADLLLMGVGIALAVAVGWIQVGAATVAGGYAHVADGRTKLQLGASRARILAEEATYAVIPVVAGSFFAWATVPAMQLLFHATLPPEALIGVHLGTDAHLAVICVALTVATLATVAIAAAAPLRAGLRHRKGTKRPRTRGSILSHMVVVQLAGTITLLYIGGVSVQSLRQVAAVDLGFDPTGVLVARLPVQEGVSTLDRIAESEAALAELEGVRSVARASSSPFGVTGRVEGTFKLLGVPNFEPLTTPVTYITPNFFRLLGIDVISGEEALLDAPRNAVFANATLSRIMEPYGSFVGRQVYITFPRTLVGLVSDHLDRNAAQPPEPHVFALDTHGLARTFLMSVDEDLLGSTTTAVRAVLSRVWQLEHVRVQPLQRDIDRATALQRGRVNLLMGIAFGSVLLSMIGTTTLLVVAVNWRQHEMSIRVALGARPDRVWTLVMRDLLLAAVPAAVAGLAFGIGLAYLARRSLFQVAVFDYSTSVGVALVMVAVGIIAASVVSRRVAHLDPSSVLRK